VNPAIVYLAQNQKADPQYGRDAVTMLRKSLDLLYLNYNDRFQHQILIFHEGDFTAEDQQSIIAGRATIRFVEIKFEIPSFLNRDEIPERWFDGEQNYFGMGHRHMIRFYGLQLFDILHDLGHDWFFRMDDDSYIHTPITYNLFEFMESNGHDYGYRVDVQEPANCSWGFGEAVYTYVKSEHITPATFFDHWTPGAASIRGRNWLQLIRRSVRHPVDALRRIYRKLLARGTTDVAKKSCQLPQFPHYDLWGYYNNFFITRVGFWRSPEVQSFLHYMDRLGGGYKYRWNDLILQSAAVQIFLPPAKVHKFADWTYEHATVIKGVFHYGGIFPGTDDHDLTAVRAFEQEHGIRHGKNFH
jgi:alpha 1,2-mannosyltransferase